MLVEVSFCRQRFFSHFRSILVFSPVLALSNWTRFYNSSEAIQYALFSFIPFLGHRAREAQAQKPGAARRERNDVVL